MAAETVILTAGGYLALLFVIAYVTDRLAAAGRARLLRSPVIYTLSLAIYCTSWTLFGAVGTAVRSGLEFVTIYIGPTLVLMAWSLFLRKLVIVAKEQRVTSIADFLSARYGKSRAVSAVVTALALVAVMPYIALQLIAVSRAFEVLVGEAAVDVDAAFWTAALMAFFVILFGTRRLTPDESQPGIVAAIAFESVVKLAAIIIVALFALYGLSAVDPADWENAMAKVGALPDDGGARWTVLTLLSAAAIVCLPRQFQVGVVENRDPAHIAVASWAFPLYLFVVSVAVMPIAVAGLTILPDGSEPDLFVLTLPAAEAPAVAMIAFIGGLSAATSMVIVASLALAVMISNHFVAPMMAVRRPGGAAGLTPLVLLTRRVAIVLVITLGYLYATVSDGDAGLASLGLIAFAGVAQFAPALLAALFVRSANRNGALCGLIAGSLVWLTTLLGPSFGLGVETTALLRSIVLPEALASGPGAVDPLVFGTVLSLALNTVLLVCVSLATRRSPVDELQATVFVDALYRPGLQPMLRRSANRRELYRLARRILGPAEAHQMFGAELSADKAAGPDLIAAVERALSDAVGAASAHALLARITTGEPLSLDAAIALAGQAQEAASAARALGVRSVELEHTVAELRRVNAELTDSLADKDAFLSRVSHEMRTPLTAVRAFAELLGEGNVDKERARRFVAVIIQEAERLTRLLDDILDLSRLEAGVAPLERCRLRLNEALADAVAALEGMAERAGVTVALHMPGSMDVEVDADRLKQLLVNVIANAIRFAGPDKEVEVIARAEDGCAVVRVIDRGPGVAEDVRPKLFTKFAGGSKTQGGQGAGLGLAISHEIAVRLGGSLTLERTGPEGSVFALSLPLAAQLARA